jgi:hypothetical protein
VAVEAVTLGTIAHRSVIDVLYGILVAADAIFLDDLSGSRFGANGVGDGSEDEGCHVVVTGLGFNQILGEQGMRGMAVVADGPFFMPGVIPTLVDPVHHVAVVAGGGVIAQVGRKIGDVKSDSDDGCQNNDCYQDGKFHESPQRPDAMSSEDRTRTKIILLHSEFAPVTFFTYPVLYIISLDASKILASAKVPETLTTSEHWSGLLPSLAV